MLIVSGVLAVYVNIVMTWVIYYLGMSFTTGPLPWSSCGNEWNTEWCRTRQGMENYTASTVNMTVGDNETMARSLGRLITNTTSATTPTLVVTDDGVNVTMRWMTPAEEFWR